MIDEPEIFKVAAALPAEERPAYLDEACAGHPEARAGVEELLRSHDVSGFMDAHAAASLGPEIEAALARLKPEEIGERIGNYKLLEQIGEGGFGTVWVAEQDRPIRRRVALKIIKMGMDTKEVITRFEQERQALALMDHPHIAKVFDAGATPTGRPYFVMELVRGKKITEYCDEARLPTAERLQLFIAVCNAVQHAHQKGIIHRDLKPSNILVELHDGVPLPKVIDFGVAKATKQQRLTDLTIFTQFEQMIGTPLYMSPEQAERSGLDVDTRSDIYSLGVLLYELLTGRTPFDPEALMRQGLDEIRRTIREQEPRTPSMFVSTMEGGLRINIAQHRQTDSGKLTSQLRGDLDWIVMKALEKDRTRRYATANGLALDIKRHLDSEPVVARPASQLYRFRRMVRRNKLAFTAGTIVTLALLGALVILVISRAGILKERNQKDAALSDAKDQLFLALLNQARAGRFSHQMGQRLDTLDALANAARMHPDERLRDEAIAAMALPDVRPGPRWSPGQTEGVNLSCGLSAEGDAQGGITIHSVPDRREVRRIASGRRTRNLTFSNDGRFLAQHDVDSELRIWRVADGQSVFGDEPGGCACWTFSADSRHLAAGKNDEVMVYDLASGRETNHWRARGTLHALFYHPDGRRIAVGYAGSTGVSIYDTDGSPVAELPVDTVARPVMAWHPDGIRVAVSGSDPRIQIWNVPAGRTVATLGGHVPVTALSFHPSGELLASAGSGTANRLWEPSSGREVLNLSQRIWGFSFGPDGRWLGGTPSDSGGQLLEVATCPEYRTIVSSLGVGEGEYFDGGISPDGRLLAMGMWDGVRLWELASGREVAFLAIGRTGSAYFQPDGRELITCGDAGVDRWTIPVRTDATQPLAFGSPQKIPLPFVPTRASPSRDGRILAVTSESGGNALVVDTATGSIPSPLFSHPNAGFVALSPDGRWVATAGWFSEVMSLWDVQTGIKVWELEPTRFVSMTFTPDSRAVVAVLPEECGLWDVRTMQSTRRLSRDMTSWSQAAFSWDGKLMALEVTPGVIHLIDAATDRTVARLTDPFGDRSTWMSFTPDGTQLVVTANYSKLIHIWNLRAIRARLKEMRLDWDWPEFPAGGESR